jgi:hypothetical protein
MKVATETKREYGDENYGRLMYRCACECGYRTMWYSHKNYAERQMAYHDEQTHETVTEVARAAARLFEPAGILA